MFGYGYSEVELSHTMKSCEEGLKTIASKIEAIEEKIFSLKKEKEILSREALKVRDLKKATEIVLEKHSKSASEDDLSEII